jgi:hypothetical protein
MLTSASGTAYVVPTEFATFLKNSYLQISRSSGAKKTAQRSQKDRMTPISGIHAEARTQ